MIRHNQFRAFFPLSLRHLWCGTALFCLIGLTACDTDSMSLPRFTPDDDWITNAESHMEKNDPGDESTENSEDSEKSQEPEANPAPEVEKAEITPAITNVKKEVVERHSKPQDTSNNKNLFGKTLKKDSERIDRLERSIQDLRDDFDRVSPSIRRLMAVEGDLQNLLTELRTLSQNPTLANPEPFRPTYTPPANQAKKTPAANRASAGQTKTPPPVTNGQASVYDVRVGKHPGKTRIVLDINAKTPYQIDIDNGEKIMIVDLPNASWSAAGNQTFGSNDVLRSYRVEASGNGSLLIFDLKKSATLLSQSDIGGASGTGRRIVIDVQ